MRGPRIPSGDTPHTPHVLQQVTGVTLGGGVTRVRVKCVVVVVEAAGDARRCLQSCCRLRSMSSAAPPGVAARLLLRLEVTTQNCSNRGFCKIALSAAQFVKYI